jgi:hypothetical protein
MRKSFCAGLTLRLTLFLVFQLVSLAASPYHLIKRIPVPGDYGWDYLTADSEGRRLYISHDREVVVLDLDAGTVLGRIPGTRIHGIAIARDLGRGFISCSDPGSVIIFDLKTLAVVDRVIVGEDPNGIIFDKKAERVFTADRGSKRLIAIDAKTGKVAGAVENLGGRTEHLVTESAAPVKRLFPLCLSISAGQQDPGYGTRGRYESTHPASLAQPGS